MADDYDLALQKAVIDTLRSDVGVTALVGQRTYDEPPQGVSYPMVQFGRVDMRPLRTDDNAAARLFFSVEGHSRGKVGRVEASRLVSAIRGALDEANLSITGFSSVFCQYRNQIVDRTTDKNHTAIVAFEALLDG